MMIAFVILFVILILILQQWTLENHLDTLEGDFSPEENILEPDEMFHIVITLKNKTRRPLYFIRIGVPLGKEFKIGTAVKYTRKNHGTGGQTVLLSTWLHGNEQAKVSVLVSVSLRGRYILSPPILSLGDFLGLKEREKSLTQFREIVVAPKEAENTDLPQLLGKFLGDHSVRRFLYEDPILTLGYREYTGREPMKMIAWKQSAMRQQTLMVKEYDHTVEPVISVLVNVDFSSSADEFSSEKKHELLETCFSLARSTCSHLESRGISYDFYTNAQIAGTIDGECSVNEGLGSPHFMKVMELLGRSMYAPSFSFSDLIRLAETSGEKNRGRIIISPTDCYISVSADKDSIFVITPDK